MLNRCPGKNWPNISAIGIGAMSFSDFYGPTDTKQAFEILKTSMDYGINHICLLYTSPSPRDRTRSRMPSSA